MRLPRSCKGSSAVRRFQTNLLLIPLHRLHHRLHPSFTPITHRSPSAFRCPVIACEEPASINGGVLGIQEINKTFRKFRNGSALSDRKFRQSRSPFEVDDFFRLDRSDRNGPFHLTIPTHSQSQYLAVWCFGLLTKEKLLWIVL